jgi:4-hydroxy-tetrahydrodipicolinate reductase
MSIKICLAGATGKMGQEVLKLADQSSKTEVVQYLQKNSRVRNISSGKPQVLVDFSLPEFFDECLSYALKNKIAFVSGTTGLSNTQKEKLKKASQKIPVLWASNMSLGVCVLKKMLQSFSVLKDYDFYVEETHHSLKKDSPSGTAITLKESLEKSIKKKTKDVFALRGGGVFGQHRIIALGPEEVITLQHDALNRTVFARGALVCASWIANKNKGFYSVEDVLSFK